ncbi:hypothetical protein BLA29_013983 [Euroglyphus maynei]|uniref:Uncharacterized protein n=1 Tax=Euroglyphus maynei TaxID=6958 RepID=A0A1Y3B099_EURMA|nr:hypothetical protein BLA29_013983 [Euroglyphus maynei]
MVVRFHWIGMILMVLKRKLSASSEHHRIVMNKLFPHIPYMNDLFITNRSFFSYPV